VCHGGHVDGCEGQDVVKGEEGDERTTGAPSHIRVVQTLKVRSPPYEVEVGMVDDEDVNVIQQMEGSICQRRMRSQGVRN
jgi:hypothetical protein